MLETSRTIVAASEDEDSCGVTAAWMLYLCVAIICVLFFPSVALSQDRDVVVGRTPWLCRISAAPLLVHSRSGSALAVSTGTIRSLRSRLRRTNGKSRRRLTETLVGVQLCKKL